MAKRMKTQGAHQVGRGVGDVGVGLVDGLLGLASHRARDLTREHVLVDEMIIEAALGDLCGGHDLIDGDPFDIARSNNVRPALINAARVAPNDGPSWARACRP